LTVVAHLMRLPKGAGEGTDGVSVTEIEASTV